MALSLVLNSPTPANFVVNDGFLQIAGARVPLPRPSLVKDIFAVSQVFQAQVWNVAFVAANNTEYTLTVSQQLTNGRITQRTVGFTSDGTATLSEIAAGLVAQVNALTQNGFLVNATGASSPITITSLAPQAYVTIGAGFNVTVAAAQPTIAPDGTAGVAITQDIAPDANPAVAVTGTTTATIQTAAAHGLQPGDVVDLSLTSAGVLTAFVDLRPGASQVPVSAVTNVIVATTPTSDTFTLQQVEFGNLAGGTYNGASPSNNDEILTITTKNVVIVNTNAAHGLVVGSSVAISGIATMTVNGGSTVSGIVRSVPSTTQFVLIGAGNGSTNTGTIVISVSPQSLSGTGAQIAAALTSGVDVLVTGSASPIIGDEYTLLSLTGFPSAGTFLGSPVENVVKLNVYLNEGAAGYAASMQKVREILADFAPGTTLADPEALAV
jgi:hypothetical protein